MGAWVSRSWPLGSCWSSAVKKESPPIARVFPRVKFWRWFRNCLTHFRRKAGTSKVTSKVSLSSSYTQTSSTPSTSTEPSYSSNENHTAPRTEGEILTSSNLKPFTFSELRNVTRNFRVDNLIGEGGFGYVYKGWIDEESFTASKPGCGLAVAVKKLKPESFQGHKEWLTEVDYLGHLQHPNLVKLIGYCSDGDNRLLMYEFMPKGSLDNYLFRRSMEALSWELRIKIAIGAARGLSFLHDAEPQVIYRDVKASNILLDVEFNAKLSDFGLAKDGPKGDMTHVSTRVMGTRGYAAPEYIATGRLSVKADVYSFGVMLLEIISGRRALDKQKPMSEQSLVDWAKPWLGDKRKMFKIMDSRLEGQYSKKGAYAAAGIALQCIHSDAKARPQMSEILARLEELQDPKYGQKTQQDAPIPVEKKSFMRRQPPPQSHRPTPLRAH